MNCSCCHVCLESIDHVIHPDWAKDLNPHGQHYYGSIVDDAETLLELHSRSTLCTFGTHTSVLYNLPSKDLANKMKTSLLILRK